MKFLINDIIGLSGFGLTIYGVYQISPALAYVLAGVGLLLWALLNGTRLKKGSAK